MRLLAAGFAALLLLSAQTAPPEAKPSTPSVLEYTGKPLAVPFQCTDEDISWGGLSCSEEEPCPVYLELTAVEAVGNKIFLAGNFHTSAVTLYSVLLGSEDAGKTWKEMHARIRGAGLDHIQFIDFETGWVSGQALSPLPQDPFLLISSDGGKTWKQKPLFGESRVGSILQFWFSAKNSGSLIVDRGQGSDGSRYELYESPNAGETWMVKETSDRPLKLKRAATGSSWRIQPEAASKAFRIERPVSGEKWSSVASFLVGAGACKPSPLKEVPEPSMDEAKPATDAPGVLVIPRRTQPPTLKRQGR
jgi:hypothetical protein